MKIKWEVYKVNDNEVVMSFNTEQEALNFCNYYDWILPFNGYGKEGFGFELDYRRVK